MPNENPNATAQATAAAAAEGQGSAQNAGTEKKETQAQGTAAAAQGAGGKTQEQKTTEKQETTTEAKAGEAKAQESVPEIEVKLPDGVEADAVLLNEFKPLAKKLGLKAEGAQELVNLALKMQTRAAEGLRVQAEKRQTEWKEAVKADKEIGGADQAKRLPVMQQALAKFGTPEFKKFLEDSRLGDHPEVIRFVYRVGKAMAEDSVAGAAATPSANGGGLESWYPKSPELFKQT